MLIRDDFIPGDTDISISGFVAHRNEKVFPETEVYNPERWLGKNGKALQPSFVAFSAGARRCIGRNISYLERKVLLASMLHSDWVPVGRETMNLHLGSCEHLVSDPKSKQV